jgi:hypothetical protein
MLAFPGARLYASVNPVPDHAYILDVDDGLLLAIASISTHAIVVAEKSVASISEGSVWNPVNDDPSK